MDWNGLSCMSNCCKLVEADFNQGIKYNLEILPIFIANYVKK